jgi:hypothetical protein
LHSCLDGLQERKQQMAAQVEAACDDLEREQQLNEKMKQAVAALERVHAQKDIAVQILEAAAGGPPATEAPQQATPAQQQVMQVGNIRGWARVAATWAGVDLEC